MTMTAKEIKQFWIGLSDRRADNLFLWSDNAPVVFTNWDRNQPPSTDSKLVGRNDIVIVRTDL